jgi:hypothetical protein
MTQPEATNGSGSRAASDDGMPARQPTPFQLRKLAYHESAHAVMQWNLGFGVERIWIDRIRDCGHSQPARSLTGRDGRIANAIVCVAGLAAQDILSPGLDTADIVRSFRDFQMALCDFMTTERLTEGEQLGLAIALTTRAVPLVRSNAVRTQIACLAPPLVKSGCLLGHHVGRLLGQLPESAEAKHLCRGFVEELIRDRDGLLASITGIAPEFRWRGPEAPDAH